MKTPAPLPVCPPALPMLLLALALAPAAAAASDLKLSQGGQYVVDERAQLVWPRCVEGMQWDGNTCTGQPLLLDRGGATALAGERWKAENLGWRLPRVPELQRLIDKSGSPPGLNPKLFPAAPDRWHWSSTSSVNATRSNPYNYGTVMQSQGGGGGASAPHGWAVNLSTGEARGDVARSSKLAVRLVRALTPEELAGTAGAK